MGGGKGLLATRRLVLTVPGAVPTRECTRSEFAMPCRIVETWSPMPNSFASRLLPAAIRRRVVRAARGVVHALALTAGLLSSGLAPAQLLSGESSEIQQRDSSAEYAELRCDARLRSRQIVVHRGDAVVLLPPTTLSGPEAGSLSHTTANSLSIVRLSLGHSAPLRC